MMLLQYLIWSESALWSFSLDKYVAVDTEYDWKNVIWEFNILPLAATQRCVIFRISGDSSWDRDFHVLKLLSIGVLIQY